MFRLSLFFVRYKFGRVRSNNNLVCNVIKNMAPLEPHSLHFGSALRAAIVV
jgi:hypothetical protein